MKLILAVTGWLSAKGEERAVRAAVLGQWHVFVSRVSHLIFQLGASNLEASLSKPTHLPTYPGKGI